MKKRSSDCSFSRAALKVLVLVLAMAATGCAGVKVLHVPDLTEVSLPSVAERIKGARVVFLGEVHDFNTHHRLQADMIRTLHERGVRLAIGVEMFRAGSQERLDRWVAGELPYKEFKKLYYSDWHVPIAQYKDIFDYARDNSIPIVALNVPRDVTKKVFSEGVGALEGEYAWLADLECDVDERYEAMIREAIAEHDHIDEESFEKFCVSQLVWDTAMAKRIVEYMNGNPDTVMVVITGGAHAWKRGIPGQLKRFEGGEEIPYVVIVPEMPGSFDRTTLDKEDTDFLLLDPWYVHF